jgi:hypothetical protein
VRRILDWRSCWVVAAVATVLISCSSADGVERAIPELEEIPTYPGAAERMPPGARAIMTIEAMLDGHEMYLHARSAQLSSQVWEDAARECFPDDPEWQLIDEERSIPPADDPFWTATSTPQTAFRPLDDGWALERGYGPPLDARLSDDRLALLDARVDPESCVFERLPFEGPNLGFISELDDPIGYLGLENSHELPAMIALAELRRAFDEPLYEMLETPDAQHDWERCMQGAGMPDSVVFGDFWETVATAVDPNAIAVADARCLRKELEAVDDELFEYAETFVQTHREALSALPDITLEDVDALT